MFLLSRKIVSHHFEVFVIPHFWGIHTSYFTAPFAAPSELHPSLFPTFHHAMSFKFRFFYLWKSCFSFFFLISKKNGAAVFFIFLITAFFKFFRLKSNRPRLTMLLFLSLSLACFYLFVCLFSLLFPTIILHFYPSFIFLKLFFHSVLLPRDFKSVYN